MQNQSLKQQKPHQKDDSKPIQYNQNFHNIIKNDDLNQQVQKIDIVFEQVSYFAKIQDQQQEKRILCPSKQKNKQILSKLTGIFKGGQISVIIGTSGSGKTTLLDILACRIKAEPEGKLFINKLQYTNLQFGEFGNYLIQKDILMQLLTVEETLQFAAKLQINAPQQVRKERIQQLAKQLKLQRCYKNLIGDDFSERISGGQKKRACIAFQILSNPQVLLLDEPTSGLDSFTSLIIVRYLKKLANKQGKTIIMTIHQPNDEIFSFFDRILLLDEGKILYQGKPTHFVKNIQQILDNACPPFKNYLQFAISQIHKFKSSNPQKYSFILNQYQETQKQTVLAQIASKNISNPKFKQKQVSKFTILKGLAHRQWIKCYRNPFILIAKLLTSLYIMVFGGGIYFQIYNKDYLDRDVWISVSGFYFQSAMGIFLSNILFVAITLPLQKPVIWKEYQSKVYSFFDYFFAKNLVQIPQLVVQLIILVLVGHLMLGRDYSFDQIIYILLLTFTTQAAGIAFGYFLGIVASSNPQSVCVITSTFLMPLVYFSGYFKNRIDLPLFIGWIEYISPFKYSFIGFVENDVENKNSLIGRMNFDVSKWEAEIILVALGICFHIFSIITFYVIKKCFR